MTELAAVAQDGRALQPPERLRDRADGRGAGVPALQLPERQRDRDDGRGADDPALQLPEQQRERAGSRSSKWSITPASRATE